MSNRPTVLAAVVLFAACLVSSSAAADDAPRLSVSWERLSDVLHDGASWFGPHERVMAGMKEHPADAWPPPWVGTSPRLSLVARDWGVSQVLWGRLIVTDQLRLSRSSRMVVTRLRLTDGRITPFAHVGLGQWRIDTTVVPALQSDAELAGQLGGGLELELAPEAVVALEGDCTMLYREGRGQAEMSTGPLWSTLLAARARF